MISFAVRTIKTDLLLKKSKPVIINPFYHTVSDEKLSHIYPLYSPKTIENFENDLDFLLHHFRPITINEEYYFLKNNIKPPQHSFVLSFDDGLRGIYENILPLLLKKGVSATIFINKDFVDNKNLFYRHKAALLSNQIKKINISKTTKNTIFNKIKNYIPTVKISTIENSFLQIRYPQCKILDELAELLSVDFQEYLQTHKPYLTIQELQNMQSHGFTIGAHSIDHPDFRDINETEQIRQIVESCKFVKEVFNEKNSFFSFPFSDAKLPDSLFKIIESKIDLSFGITGINCKNNHVGRIDMEKCQNAKETINRAFLKYFL